jgi:RNA polymerase sigma-70 factor (ECF subfamily)
MKTETQITEVKGYNTTMRIKNGEYAILEELYDRYNRQAFNLALKMLRDPQAAEDLVQEAFLRVWQQSESYDPARGRFNTWLLSVVHNMCIDQLRKKRLRAVSLDQDEAQQWVPYLADTQEGPEEEVWVKQKRETIQRNLSTLPSEQRELLELAFFGGYSHSQIAAKTGRTLGTVKYRIRQALIRLHTCTELFQLAQAD